MAFSLFHRFWGHPIPGPAAFWAVCLLASSGRQSFSSDFSTRPALAAQSFIGPAKFKSSRLRIGMGVSVPAFFVVRTETFARAEERHAAGVQYCLFQALGRRVSGRSSHGAAHHQQSRCQKDNRYQPGSFIPFRTSNRAPGAIQKQQHHVRVLRIDQKGGLNFEVTANQFAETNR